LPAVIRSAVLFEDGRQLGEPVGGLAGAEDLFVLEDRRLALAGRHLDAKRPPR